MRGWGWRLAVHAAALASIACATPLLRSAANWSTTSALPAATGAVVDAGVTPTVSVEERKWRWRWGDIHYEVAGEGRTGGTPLVLLPGFGVGTFHFNQRNMPQLSEALDRPVFSMDYLGQGQSWPVSAPTEEDSLRYSANTWRDQIADFIAEVVKEPAYLIGNSLGGHLSVMLAAHRPELCKGVALLNPTPIWGFNSPQRPLYWDGLLPAPRAAFAVGAFYFDQMRNPRTVKAMLSAVYADKRAVDDSLVADIIAATERGPTLQSYGVGGHEAFTSILFSPRVEGGFDALLRSVTAPVALLYGRDDPWITPLWGHRAKRAAPRAPYYELTPSGHCPHHETPAAVNHIVGGWIKSIESGGPPPLTPGGDPSSEIEEWLTGAVTRVSLVGAEPRSLAERLDDWYSRYSGSSSGDAPPAYERDSEMMAAEVAAAALDVQSAVVTGEGSGGGDGVEGGAAGGGNEGATAGSGGSGGGSGGGAESRLENR
eukprot:TRINITY_DN226_c2_g1_i1.p1 TRINITY_DN226_c2_g1~~TRINITY_DN226_c2_g1_i1.p1  ORF type:complete len:485 (-),score=150.70 TRINITY_DN226_c2_g1_i1:303-1757(-)